MKLLKKACRLLYFSLKKYYSIVRLKKASRQSTVKIVVGASNIYNKGWVPTEIDYLNMLKRNDWETFFNKNAIDAILAEHVWEHLTIEDGELAAKNCFNYLKPNGYLRIAVPDGFHPMPEYIDYVKEGGSGSGADDHKVLYTYKSISEMLQRAGFVVKLLEFFDENGIFCESAWNPEDGFIRRSKNFDSRNVNGQLNYTSLIVDAIKPQ